MFTFLCKQAFDNRSNINFAGDLLHLQALEPIRAEIVSHQLAASKSLEHTKSLMDTAVAMVERKLNEKADFSTFQVLKEVRCQCRYKLGLTSLGMRRRGTFDIH